MKKFWSIFLNTILVAFVIVGVLLIVSIVPIKNNYRIFSVMSGSMEPAIPVGSLIVVKPTVEYQKDDIITFKSTQKEGDFTTHRIDEVRDVDGLKSYITKGDANEMPDFESVDAERVVGREIFTIALAGYVLWFVKTLPGLIIIIIIPALIIIYDEMDKIKKEIKKFKNKKNKKKGKNDKNSNN